MIIGTRSPDSGDPRPAHTFESGVSHTTAPAHTPLLGRTRQPQRGPGRTAAGTTTTPIPTTLITTPTDLYAILGLNRNATPAQISHAYRTLLRRYHPDTRTPGDRSRPPRR